MNSRPLIVGLAVLGLSLAVPPLIRLWQVSPFITCGIAGLGLAVLVTLTLKRTHSAAGHAVESHEQGLYFPPDSPAAIEIKKEKARAEAAIAERDAARDRHQTAAADLTITSAKWGNEYNTNDVSRAIRDMTRNAFVIYVNQDAFRDCGPDPAPGFERKYVDVTYAYRGWPSATVRRYQNEWLVLPEDSKLIGERDKARQERDEAFRKIEELKTAVKAREYPWAMFTIQDVYIEPQPTAPDDMYRTKLLAVLTNATGKTLEAWSPTWESQDVQPQYPLRSVLQLEDRGGGGWQKQCWGDEQQCLSVLAGETFKCWIGLMPPVGEGFVRRIDQKTTGELIFQVKMESKLYEVKVSL